MVLWLQRYENNSICVFFSLAIDILSTINVQIMPYSVLIDVHPLFLIGLQYNIIRRYSHLLIPIRFKLLPFYSDCTFKIEVQQTIHFFHRFKSIKDAAGLPRSRGA